MSLLLFLKGLSEERFQQQEEKLQQLRQDLRRVQNLCSSAERELRYEREKNADLQRQNLLLQQECTKVGTEPGSPVCSASAPWELKARGLEPIWSQSGRAGGVHLKKLRLRATGRGSKRA